MINYEGFLYKDYLILLTGKKSAGHILWRLIFFISKIQLWLRTPKETSEIGNLHVCAVEFNKHGNSCVSSTPGGIHETFPVACGIYPGVG